MSEKFRTLPNLIRKHFNNEQWESLDDIERNYYLTYLSNPNHFFFRSSFLEQTPLKGEFNNEELEKFNNRLKYFRETLKIQRIPWGYFSATLIGRAGYQCAMHYRELLISKAHEPDLNYPFTPSGYPQFIFEEDVTLLREASDALEHEMYNLVIENKKHADWNKYKQTPKKYMIQNTRYDYNKAVEPKISRKSPKSSKENNINQETTENNKDTIKNGSSVGQSAEIDTQTQDSKETEDKNNPIPNFIDPITKMPIKNPMLDINGFVMGKESWEKCFVDPSIAPCEMSVTCVQDLIALTNDNFESMKAFIINLS